MKDTNKLINEYLSFAIEQGKALEIGDSKTVNKFYDKIIKTIKKLKELGPEAILKLEPYLNEENDHVAVCVAYDLLPYKTAEAEATLLRISQKGGLVSFDAEMTLKEWRKGNLKFE